MRAAHGLGVAIALIIYASLAVAEPLTLLVKNAEVRSDANGIPALGITLTPQSAKEFSELTAKNVGKVVELRIDGKVVLAPIVREPIVGASLQISGTFDKNELPAIAQSIAAGDAKVEVEAKPD